MIQKKQLKNSTKKKTSQGYDLNNIKTKKASQPKKKNGALHGFFSLMGYVVGIGSLMALIVPMVAHAKQGVYIVEPFNCEVALADYTELQRRLEVTPRTNWKYEIFLFEYEAVAEELEAHAECEVK
jgi:hypothetical protein